MRRPQSAEPPFVQVAVSTAPPVEHGERRQFRLDLEYERTETEGALFDRMSARLEAVASLYGVNLLAACGFFSIVFINTINVTLQQRVTDVLRARVMSLYVLVLIGSGLWMAALLMMAQTVQQSANFSALHPVIVGINAYKSWPKLSYAVNDAVTHSGSSYRATAAVQTFVGKCHCLAVLSDDAPVSADDFCGVLHSHQWTSSHYVSNARCAAHARHRPCAVGRLRGGNIPGYG